MRAQMTIARAGVASLLAAAALAAPVCQQPALAQVTVPIGRFVVDARGAMAPYPAGDEIAAPRGLQAADLPARGFGLQVGGDVFLVRWRVATLGVGAQWLWTQGTQDPQAAEDGTTVGTETTTRMTAFSPQVSLNFGSGRGWSYVSGGLGAARRSVSSPARDEPGAWAPDLHVGGGARWFFADHLGVGFDVRLHSVSAQDPGTSTAGFPRTTKFTFAAGLSFQ